MLRNHSDDKISDRFITGRNGERERILDKFKVEEGLNKKYIDDLYLTPHHKSQPKNRQLNFIEDDEIFNQKIYLNLLKSQIFEGRTTCSQEKKINTEKKLSTKNFKSSINKKIYDNNSIGKDLNKTFFNNINLINNSNNNNNNSNNHNNININSLLSASSNKKTKSNQTINNIPRFNKKNNNTYTNNLISSNYSLIITKKTKNLLLKKRLFEDNEKYNNIYGNVFKQSYSDFLNFEIDDNDTTINYLKYKSIPKTAYKVLDAPNLRDDFYLHLVDWSKQDIVAVGLDSKLYTWNAKYSEVSLLSDLDDYYNYYSSLAYNNDGKILISCSNDGTIFVRNVEKSKNVKIYREFSEGRICVVSPMNLNPNLFSIGAKDLIIKTIDLRSKLNPIMKYVGHSKEICGMKWSLDDKRLASGGDDNKLFIWDIRKEESEKKLSSHTSAIKALDWSTYKFGYLLSGGGTQDMTLKLWNINNMTLVDSINTSSQICNIAFSKISHEFITTHGFKNNYIHVWDSNKMDIKATLKGHKQRVIYMGLGPDSKKIVTGAGDETIRFWDVFGHENQKYSFFNNNPEISLIEEENYMNKYNKKKDNVLNGCEIR
jgi:cell division cycle 20-like protein 1 (cofactor of APC complex)